jgi:hypothetical protein
MGGVVGIEGQRPLGNQRRTEKTDAAATPVAAPATAAQPPAAMATEVTAVSV